MNTPTESKTPRVSVIIPVRDGIDFVREALDSVTSQSFSDFELLLVDDGSKDADYRQFEKIDQRVRVIRLEGVGVSGARNAGLLQARGDLLAFLDADDVWFPGKLEAQVHHFDQHPDVGVVFGKFIRWNCLSSGVFPEASTLIENVSQSPAADPQRSGWLYTQLLNGLLVGMNTAVVKRSVYEAIGGFDQSMLQGEDYDFWLKSSRIAPMHCLDSNVALYRIHSASAMHKLNDRNQLGILLQMAALRWGLGDMQGNQFPIKRFSGRLASSNFDHAYSHFWHGDIKIAKEHFKKSITNGNKKIKALLYWLASNTFTKRLLKSQIARNLTKKK